MILVTGSSGFLGKQLCACLRQRGHRVMGLDLRLPTQSEPWGESAQCDLTDSEAVTKLISAHDIEMIIHLAALLRTASCDNPGMASRINIGGSVNLFEAARGRVKRIVYGSSITAYGTAIGDGHRGVQEDFPAAPVDMYGGSKRYVEILGDAFHDQRAFEFVSIRLPSIIGAGSGSSTSPWRSAILEYLRHPSPPLIEIPFSPDQAMPLVHAQDAIEAIARLAESQRFSFSLYNSPAHTWTFGEMAQRVTALNPKVQFTFGEAKVVGHPIQVDASRFEDEFGFTPSSLQAQLQSAAEQIDK